MSEPKLHEHAAEHLGHEHATLRQSLELIRHALEGPAQEGVPGELLERFYDDVERHFAEEEDGGCFDEAVSRAPQLTRRVAELMQQHPSLLEELRALCREAKRNADPTVVAERLETFARRWLQHESAENRVLQEAFNRDVGAVD